MEQTPSESPTLSNLQDRIALTNALLQSADENVPSNRTRLEQDLIKLEALLQAKQREEHRRQYEKDMKFLDDSGLDGHLPLRDSRPQSSHASLPNVGFAPYAGSSRNNFGGHFASDGVMAGQGRTAAAPPWSIGSPDSVSRISDTPNFPLPEGSASSSPSSGFLVPQKRQRESFGLSNDFQTAKTMRTTPSPAMTGTTTPTSLGSFDFPEDPDLFRLIGGNPKDHLREMREEQKAQESYLEARKKQEREDEEFARSLQEEADRLQTTPSPRENVDGVRWGTSQTVFDSQGRHHQADTQLSSPAAIGDDPFSHSRLPVKQENRINAYAPTARSLVKNEKTYGMQPDPAQLDNFVDLDDVSSPEARYQGLPSHPSSDLVELDTNTFHDNNRQNPPPGSIPDTYSPNHTGFTSANPASWGYNSGQFGQSLVDATKGLMNSAYNAFNPHLPGSGPTSMDFGGTPVYDNNGLGSSSNIPFIDLEDYNEQPQSLAHSYLGMHGYNPNDPVNRALLESYTERINYVTHDPTRTSEDIKSLLENIRPDEELPPENREGTPEGMVYALMEHQKLGLAWMKSMEEGSNKGGILADDMGLGKTIQALALMVGRKSPNRLCKTTLIVAPVALLKQWEREISLKLKSEHRLKTFILHGSGRHATWDKLRNNDVVLTTFGTLATEVKRKEAIEMNKIANPNWKPTGKADHLPLLGDECKWYRVIIDEAQCIKNKATKAAQGANQLQALTRFCMTGTPMMNNVSELYSLIHFLRIKPYCEGEKFRRDFMTPLKGSSPGMKEKAMRQLQALLKAVLLRRTKKSEIDGKPILNLPERTTEIRHAVFSKDEEEYYQALENRTRLRFNKFLKAGTVGRNYSNILVLLLRLRQACCHPHLIKDFGQASGDTDVTAGYMLKLAKELAPDVVARIKGLSGNIGEESLGGLECPVCMDSADNATIFIPCGHNTCSECFARISDPTQAIADGNVAEGRNTDVKCPSCRGKVNPSRVIDHNAFKKVHMPEQASDGLLDEMPQLAAETTDDSDSDIDEDDDSDVNSQGDLNGFIVADGVIDDGSETEGHDEPLNKYDSAIKKSKKSKKGKEKARENKVPRKNLAQLKKEGLRNTKARKRYLKRLEKDWIPSRKIEKTMEILEAIQDRKDPKTNQCEKTIVFSQFTSLLDLLEVPIHKKGWGYRRYDGSMNSNARNDAVIEFTDKKDCKIMLISLKAGNAGLNLVAASQVIIFDPFWNPYIEEQAVDRAHRIGQQRPVQVHRILVPNTVEDRILALQEKKRELIDGALDEKASQSIGRLGVRELGFLFDVPT